MLRLETIERGYDRRRGPPDREPADIAKVLTYRSELWGLPWSRAAEEVLRGPSDWSIGQRELFAAFVSVQNRCQFCTGAHTATASLTNEGGEAYVAAVLEDRDSAPLSHQLRATLEFLRKLTLEPERFGPADVEPVLNAGVSPGAVRDAMHVCALFCIINRCADALGAEEPDEHAPGGIHRLITHGYLVSFPEAPARSDDEPQSKHASQGRS